MAEPTQQLRPMLGDRSLFPELEARAYLAHAAVAPPARPVLEAVQEALTGFARVGQAAFAGWAVQRERLRQKLATLLGVSPKHLALLGGTTRAISDLALAIPWQRGQTVLLFDGEFPANTTPWQRAAELYELQVKFISLHDAVRDPGIVLERLEQDLKRGARLVAASAVQFQTGLLMPLAEMARLCHEHGAELAVDSIQAAGVVPFDITALELDYVAGGAHKWLLGIEGAGYLYVHPERMPSLRPFTAGWLSHDEPLGFLVDGAGLLDYQRPLKQNVEVFEGGSSSVASFAALEAGVDLLLKLGVSEVFDHVSQYLDRLQAGVEARGWPHLRSPVVTAHSGILSLRPSPDLSLPRLTQQLRERGVYASTPDGLLRFAPHFANGFEEVESVLAVLDECFGA